MLSRSQNPNGLGDYLKHAQHAYRNYLDDLLRHLGISSPQYNVMHAVFSEKNMTNARLARNNMVTPQTMQSVVSKLQNVGLVEKSEIHGHPKAIGINLTDRGVKTLSEARICVERADKILLEAIGDKNAVLFQEILSRCAKKLQF